MDERTLATLFDKHRNRLRGVAYRMLGSQAEADDAVQEVWLRLSGSDADSIDNLGGWLTTVTSRVCLNMLRSRSVRREDPGRPEVCNIFSYHKVFNQQKEAGIDESALGVATVEEVAENCRGAKWGCVECKQQLCKKLGALLDPMRERRSYWEQHPDDLFDVLKAGTARANEEGQKTLERVRTAMHMDYFGG